MQIMVCCDESITHPQEKSKMAAAHCFSAHRHALMMQAHVEVEYIVGPEPKWQLADCCFDCIIIFACVLVMYVAAV
jgi:hypothetical protein